MQDLYYSTSWVILISNSPPVAKFADFLLFHFQQQQQQQQHFISIHPVITTKEKINISLTFIC